MLTITIGTSPILILSNCTIPSVGMGAAPILEELFFVPILFVSTITGICTIASLPFLPFTLIKKMQNKKNLPLIQETNDLLRTLMMRQENKLLTLKEAATDYEIML